MATVHLPTRDAPMPLPGDPPHPGAPAAASESARRETAIALLAARREADRRTLEAMNEANRKAHGLPSLLPNKDH